MSSISLWSGISRPSWGLLVSPLVSQGPPRVSKKSPKNHPKSLLKPGLPVGGPRHAPRLPHRPYKAPQIRKKTQKRHGGGFARSAFRSAAPVLDWHRRARSGCFLSPSKGTPKGFPLPSRTRQGRHRAAPASPHPAAPRGTNPFLGPDWLQKRAPKKS